MASPMQSPNSTKRRRKGGDVFEHDNVTAVFRTLFDLGMYTQTEVAQKVGISQSAVSDWLSGKRRIQFPLFDDLASMWGLSGRVFTTPATEVKKVVGKRLEAIESYRKKEVQSLLEELAAMDRYTNKPVQVPLFRAGSEGKPGRHLVGVPS